MVCWRSYATCFVRRERFDGVSTRNNLARLGAARRGFRLGKVTSAGLKLLDRRQYLFTKLNRSSNVWMPRRRAITLLAVQDLDRLWEANVALSVTLSGYGVLRVQQVIQSPQ